MRNPLAPVRLVRLVRLVGLVSLVRLVRLVRINSCGQNGFHARTTGHWLDGLMNRADNRPCFGPDCYLYTVVPVAGV